MTGRLTGFDRWPTGAKLLFLLSLVLLPLGMVLAWAAWKAFDEADQAKIRSAQQQGTAAAQAIESLVARNALALRIASNGAFRSSPQSPCDAVANSLALTPAIASRFVLRSPNGELVCSSGTAQPHDTEQLVAPGDIRIWISDERPAIVYRVGVIGGMGTGDLVASDLAAGVRQSAGQLVDLIIADGHRTIDVIDGPPRTDADPQPVVGTHSIAGGQLTVRTVSAVARTMWFERLILLLPLLMWVVATLLSWLLVKKLLIQPLDRLKTVVTEYQPGQEPLYVPDRLGPATEIRELGSAFERAVERIEQSERTMAEALEGQRRLVREVHHRVKNNLQVVASLLNIHGRSAATPEASDAYAAIGRRVDALSVVHRNHFAEVEESRGIALRPLLVELAATLRASAPNTARALVIQLDADDLYTTQDSAVAVAFFITEVVEFAMLRQPDRQIEIELRRTSELSARLTLASDVLVPGDTASDVERRQFERVVGGLARQLRSPLDEKVGRLSVDIPVFPK